MKIYFGDNQFLGVNHSQGKGGEYFVRYQTPEDIAVTLREAWGEGVRDFCFTVTPKTVAAINMVISECPFDLHPSLPYAQSTNTLIAELGLVGAIRYKFKKHGYYELTVAILAAFFKRYDRIVKLLILSELDGIPVRNIKSIGLLNVATDFLLGLERHDILNSFDSVVRDKLMVKTVFYTMNFPMLAEVMWGTLSSDCAIVFNINKNSFRTNPNLDSVISTVNKFHDRETIGMSLFSGGDVNNFYDIVQTVPSLKGILFGSSSVDNIRENIHVIQDVGEK